MPILEMICLFSVGLIVYSYVVYPVLLGLFSRLRPRQSQINPDESLNNINEADWPTVSLVIAAYKEEDVIGARIENALSLTYPADKLEILIGVDGNEDRTGEIVAGFNDPRVKLLQFPQRRGKASVLNDAIPAARGDIVLLSDANTFWDVAAAQRLVAHFADQKVGGVCGRLILTDAETGENVDGLYWRYENWLKEKEGAVGALLGANGAIYAIRKALFEPIPPNTIVDDFFIGMRIHLARWKFLYDKRAIAREETAPTIRDEFQRRVRIGAGNFQSLVWLSRLLLPDYGTICWAYWSHKVLRWICPWLMLIAWAGSFLLAAEPVFYGLMLAQGTFYLLALVGFWWPQLGKIGSLGKVAWMFVMMNVALGCGLFRWLFRSQKGTWKRTQRLVVSAR